MNLSDIRIWMIFLRIFIDTYIWHMSLSMVVCVCDDIIQYMTFIENSYSLYELICF